VNTLYYVGFLKGAGEGYEIDAMRGLDGSLQAHATLSAAIRAGSPNKLNAYNFIRILLSAKFQNDSTSATFLEYSVRRASISRRMHDLNDAGWDLSAWERLSLEEVQAYLDLVLSVEKCSLIRSVKYSPLYKLFLETMLPYFRDQKDLDECLKELDYRLMIYASE